MDCLIDIVFMLDTSKSISRDDFDLMKSFVSRLIDRMDVDSGNTRVGLVTYSDFQGSAFNLNDYISASSLQSTIELLGFNQASTNWRNFSYALHYVRTRMLISPAGDRPSVPDVIVLFTGGQSQNLTATSVSIEAN